MRLLPALALSGALLTGACANPDGSLNLPATLAIGAGVAVAGLAIASANDRPRHGYHRAPPRGYGYGRPAYAHGYGGPYQRRW